MLSNSFDIVLVLWPLLAAFLFYFFFVNHFWTRWIKDFDTSRAKRGKIFRFEQSDFLIAVTVIEFLLMLLIYFISSGKGAEDQFQVSRSYVLDLGLSFRLDGFRRNYALIAAFMFMVSALFSKEYFEHARRNLNRYYFFYLITLGATMAVFMAESFFTLFIFFEVMSLASFIWVVHDESAYARRAAMQYLFVGVIGGMGILIGLFLTYSSLGTLQIGELVSAVAAYEGASWILYLTAFMFVVGFAGKAGVFLLHFWLPAAHPIAPAPASALLSGILTKAGVFGIMIVSAYLMFDSQVFSILMLILGAAGMLIGAFRALFAINIKTTLALSSVSQIGFITIGIGMQYFLGNHDGIAVRGTFLHMVNHSLLKLLLFNLAGLIYVKAHSLNINELRGFGRGKPVLMLSFLVGALSIGGVPLFSGFISKTLLHESIVEHIWYFSSYNVEAFWFQILEALFILAGGFTVAYMAKLFVAIFLEKNPDSELQKEYQAMEAGSVMITSKIGMILTAGLIFIIGFFPGIMDIFADQAEPFMNGTLLDHRVNYFAWINIKGAFVSIIIGMLVYFFIIRPLMITQNERAEEEYINQLPVWVDIYDLFWEPLMVHILPFILNLAAMAIGFLPGWIGSKAWKSFRNFEARFHYPLESEGLDKKAGKESVSGVDMFISSSLASSLLQFAGGAVIVTLIVWFINWLN